MYKRSGILFGCVFSVSMVTVTAGEKEEDPADLALEEKLQEIYEQYRVGNIVSLRRRQKRVGFGLNYFASERGGFGIEQSSRAVMGTAFAGYGLTDRLEVFASAPVLWSEQKLSFDGFSHSESTFGFSDPTVRLLAALPTKEVDTTGIFSVTMPVGKDAVSRGSWHTSFGGNVNWVLDPVVLYGGATWEHDWTQEVNGIGYNAGVSFLANHALSVGAEFSGNIVLTSTGGLMVGGALQGLDQVVFQDSMLATVRVSYQATPSFGINPSVSTGLTDNMPDVIIGVNAFWRF